MISSSFAFLLTVSAIFLAFTAESGEVYPRLIFGNAEHKISADGNHIFFNHSHLSQVEINKNTTISLSGETETEVFRPQANSGDQFLFAIDGDILIFLKDNRKVKALEKGQLAIIKSNDVIVLSNSIDPEHRLAMKQPFQLGNLILTRQDQYLDSLKTNITITNSAVVNVINGLFRPSR